MIQWTKRLFKNVENTSGRPVIPDTRARSMAFGTPDSCKDQGSRDQDTEQYHAYCRGSERDRERKRGRVELLD